MCEGDWEKFNEDDMTYPKWWVIDNIYSTTDGFTMIAVRCNICWEAKKGCVLTEKMANLLVNNKEEE